MFKIYLDASVIIAALLSPTGGSAKLIELSRLRILTAATSQTVIEEIEAHSSKIKQSQEKIARFVAQTNILVREKIFFSEAEPFFHLVDPDDAHLVAGAIATGCEYLVTLDKKHLLKPEVKNKFQSLKIVSPKEMLEVLKSKKVL